MKGIEFVIIKSRTSLSLGLHYIHNKQLVHLDIKPDNILLATEEPGFENEGAYY